MERYGDVSVLCVMAAPAEYGAHLKARIQPLMTGIGPVEGAVGLTAALARLEARGDLPDLVLSLGSCGSPTLEHAAVYQVSSVGYRDMDASALGFPKGITPLLDLPAVMPLPCPIPGVPTASLSTGGNVVSGAAYEAVEAEMVDMETFALMRACQTFGLPLVALRGVSDGRAELKALEDWTSTLHHVDEALAAALDRLIGVLEARGLAALDIAVADRQDPAIHALPGIAYAMTTPVTHQKVLIVDFGSQVTQLIARRLREAGVYCEIHPFSKVEALVDDFDPQAIILSGGPASVLEADSPRIGKKLFDLGLPMLAICYGQQLLCDLLGGKVEGGHDGEFGRAEITLQDDSPLFAGIGGAGHEETVWMSHGDRVVAIPEGFKVIATSPGAPFAAIADEARKIYAVQFHPEVHHTPRGAEIYRNFLFGVAGLKGDWTMAAYRDEKIAQIREQVGSAKVICGLSGGVDSSVAAVLIHEAIGDQLTCVFVDTGLLRKDEAKQVTTLFREHYNIPLVHVDASKEFLGQLAGISDPETKRKTIGRVFIEIFDREANKIEGAEFLAQGTLYPDVIESVSASGGPSAVIKSHHNVGGLPDYMKLKLVEPLRELFKDEVRALGRELGLTDAFVGRHPFPGPGLAIRIPGEITPEAVETLQQADAIYLEEIRKAGLYDQIWQAFAVLLPVKTVGVMGDARTYEKVLALRAVSSTDGMTADFYQFPWDVLGKTATRIINEVRGVNRVVYDVTSKPPGTIEWE